MIRGDALAEGVAEDGRANRCRCRADAADDIDRLVRPDATVVLPDAQRGPGARDFRSSFLIAGDAMMSAWGV
ncbi:hypothetical protein ABZ871_10435 [Streptomyces populi]